MEIKIDLKYRSKISLAIMFTFKYDKQLEAMKLTYKLIPP